VTTAHRAKFDGLGAAIPSGAAGCTWCPYRVDNLEEYLERDRVGDVTEAGRLPVLS